MLIYIYMVRWLVLTRDAIPEVQQRIATDQNIQRDNQQSLQYRAPWQGDNRVILK